MTLMLASRIPFVAAAAYLLLSSGRVFSADDDLLNRARKATGGLERFHRLQSVEIKGIVADDAAAPVGAMAFRIKLPDKFAVVERTSTRRYAAALDKDNYWAKLGDRELPWNEDGRRRLRYRFNYAAASYLLHVNAVCDVTRASGVSSVSVDPNCGGFRLDFDPSSFRLRALSHDVTVLKGGSVDELKKASGTNPIDALLQRPSVKASVRTEYFNYRMVDGWRIPYKAVTKNPFGTTTFSVSSVRFNLPLTNNDFKEGKSLSGLQQWVDSATR